MSVKVNFFIQILYTFPANLIDYSEEQDERFYQCIKIMEQRYKGCCDRHRIFDYCCTLHRDGPEKKHSRKSNNFTSNIEPNLCFAIPISLKIQCYKIRKIKL